MDSFYAQFTITVKYNSRDNIAFEKTPDTKDVSNRNKHVICRLLDYIFLKMAYAWKSHTNLRRVYNRVTIAICDLVPSYITVQHTNKEVDNLEQAKEEEEE